MEQATNLFTKGLQMDSHPMVQGNDTLTDCLNGTLITMNGNEVILLNDMGNRRVDKAFLPPGYEPVGMKEYGGIIYVAAYNPITNKSLIGSFPSPLKKIDSSLSGEEFSGIFDFDNFTEGNYNVETDSVLNISVLKSDSFIFPLTNDINLRAGDKFAIYSQGLSSMSNLLTNYNNTQGNKARSPKNKKYTILVGVLNSLNEFVDITKTLCRWSYLKINPTSSTYRWLPNKYDSEVSEIYKFNDGYFISDSFDNSDYNETIADATLIRQRLKIAANTYSYKLVGPLYLKISLNHIERFNYNIYGTYDNGVATLWIEGYITYNCPDNSSGSGNNSNEDYATFDEGIPSSDFGFDLIGKTPDSGKTIIKNSIYNPNNNTYTTKIVKKYSNITGASGSTIFNYVLGVKAYYNTPGIYLRGLSAKGSIDLSLLGSGVVKFDGWRFYNNVLNRSTILTFSFNSYPEYGKTFGNLSFKFHDIEKGSDHSNDIIYPKVGYLPLYNGKLTIEIDWDEYGFESLKTYSVTSTYYSIDNETGATGNLLTVSEPRARWFLSTELFNEFYLSSAGINDYCNVINNAASSAFYSKMVVNLVSSTTIKNESSKDKDVFEGSLIRFNSDAIDYSCKHNWNVVITTNPSLDVKNKELYPNYVSIKSNKRNSIQVDTVNISLIGTRNNPQYDSTSAGNICVYSNTLKELLEIKQGKNITTTSLQAIGSKNILETKLDVSGNSIIGYIQYYDVFKSKGDTVDTISNVFDNFSEILNTNDVLPSASKYGGIFCNFDDPEIHYIDVAVNLNDNITLLEDSNRHPGQSNLFSKESTKRVDVNVSSIVDLAYLYFNDSSGLVTFLYLFANDNRFPAKLGLETGLSGLNYTRVWWKMLNGEWAVFPNLYLKGSNIKDFILNSINKDLVYCMYNTVSNSTIYAPKEDYIYYDTYSIPLVCSIRYKLVQGESASTVLNLGNPCGNLVFTATSGSPNIDNDSVTFLLDSSETFIDNINKFDANNISNVYIKGGLTHDSLGRPLNPGHIYSLENGKLVKLNNNNFYIDSDNPVNDKNRLLYNIINKGSVNAKYQAAGRDERKTHTVLIYDSVNVVKAVYD